MRVVPQVDLRAINNTWFSLKIKRQTVKDIELLEIKDWKVSEMTQFEITIDLDTTKVSTMKGDILSFTILEEAASILLNSVLK